MILAIPLLAICTSHQRKMMEHRAPQNDAQVRQLVSQVEMLQDRVHVLERIVTDQGYSVASQIEALRDQRRVEDLVEHHAGKEASR
jgi:hypothetical protein